MRPILNKWHPETKKLTYWFPLLFCLSLIGSIVLVSFNIVLPLYCILGYYTLAFVLVFFDTKSVTVAFSALIAITIQFFGYGFGFLKSTLLIGLLNKNPEETFPNLFFKKN